MEKTGNAMRVEDWGERTGRLAAFGGTVSNRQATDALVARLSAEGLLSGSVCTGDLAAYGADPAGTVAAVRRAGARVIAGNCEKGLSEGSGDCGCGFADGTACDRMSGAWWAHATAALDDQAKRWMGGLPDVGVLRHGGALTAVIHGGVADVARFLWPSDPDAVFADEIEALDGLLGAPVDRVIAGHCGIAFTRDVPTGGRVVKWINAGSAGMPPHDGRPETRFVVIEPDGMTVIHRLDYDHAAAASDMRAAGLTQGYDRALETGFWPSEDVLPPELRC